MRKLSSSGKELLRRYEHARNRLCELPHADFVSSLLPGGARPLSLLFAEEKLVHSVRLTLVEQYPKFRAPLFLRGIEFLDCDQEGEAALAPVAGRVELSSFYEEFGGFPDFAVNQVQEPYAFHTRVEHNPWAVITLNQPAYVRGIRLHTRLRRHETAFMQNLRLEIRLSEHAGWETLFYYPDIFERFIDDSVRLCPPAPDSGFTKEDAAATDAVFTEALLGNYCHYRLHHRFARMSPAVCTKDLIELLDEKVAQPRGLAATSYGINCPFRLWTEEEKVAVLDAALGLIEKLKTISPQVCFAFGTALGFVRDQGFIPHDRDIDIYMGLPHFSHPLRKQDLAELARRLIEMGLWVVWFNERAQLINVFIASGVPKLPVLDVYLCVTENDNGIYRNPNGIYEKTIPADYIFPPENVTVYGRECPVPGRPDLYLTHHYGRNWRTPVDVNTTDSEERKRYRKLYGAE